MSVEVKIKTEQQNVTKVENSKPEESTSKSKPKAPQPPKFKAFEIIRKNFANAGITPTLVKQSYPFNGTVLIGFFMLTSAIYGTSVFIIIDAYTFAEYTQSIYADSLLILIAIAVLILILKVKNLFEFIVGCDYLVNVCEYVAHLFVTYFPNIAKWGVFYRF